MFCATCECKVFQSVILQYDTCCSSAIRVVVGNVVYDHLSWILCYELI